MTIKKMLGVVALLSAFSAGLAVRDMLPAGTVAHAQAGPRVFELRTYTANEGKLPLLHATFKDHLLGFFKKHGMTNVVYFKPMDAPLSQTTLIYLVSHESREAATKSWAAFRNDPEWKTISSANGPMASKVDSVFLEATDYSPMK